MLKFDDDALPHKIGDSLDWRESYYCNFFDHNSDLCGLFYLGKRPNAGVGETVFLLADGGKDLIREVETKDAVQDNGPDDRRKAGNQEFICVEPWKHWRMRYANGKDWLELDWHQLTDICDWDWGWGEAGNEPAKHFQAAGKVSGRGVVGGKDIHINGYGERDRAWGPRNYAILEVSFWQTLQFPDDVAIHAFLVRESGGENFRLLGFLHKNNETRDLARVDMSDLVYQSERGPPIGGKIRYEDTAGRVVEISSIEFVNILPFGSHTETAGQLITDLDKVDNVMLLGFYNYKRSDGVQGRGMIDYVSRVGVQPESASSVAPVDSTLYKFGRK